MSLVLQSSGGGSVTIAEPTTASNFTQTLPAADGVTMVSGNQPAFNATATSRSAANVTATEMAAYNTPNFDTASCFNTTTGRFTPNVAGYYQFSWTADFGGNGIGAATVIAASLYKNGSSIWASGIGTSAISFGSIGSSAVIFMNGTTDFASCFVFQNSGVTVSSFFARFAGVLVRAA
jgi:hypothetical protein